MGIKLRLMRAHTPADIGEQEKCGICDEEFIGEVVLASLYSANDEDLGYVCRNCVEIMGFLRPDLFPTIEEYRGSLKRWDGPIWANTEEASEAYRLVRPHLDAVLENTVAR